MKSILAFACLALISVPAVPVSAQAVESISASDKATGAKAHPDLVKQFGGAVKGPPAAYVERVGRRIAVQSGLSGSERDFTVTLLDSPVNNAFAIPGGYVYVTRGLLALMNDEAELASVLGHEVGHVAARHAAKRQQTSAITSVLAGVLGAVAGNSGLGSLVGRGAGVGADLITKGFSRTQEYQADDLGVRYLARAGYDPYASSDMLALLGAQESLDARTTGKDNAVPTWASTHPNSADRVERARSKAREAGANGQAMRNREGFLAAIDGMIYGDDPAKGFMDGQVFKLPNERLAFTVKPGFTVDNGDDAVTIRGSGGQAMFAGGMVSGGLSFYVDQLFRGLAQGGVNHGDIRFSRPNGVEMAYAFGRANSNAGLLDVGVFVYQAEKPGFAYSVVTLAAAGQGAGPFQPLVDSMRRLSPREVADIRPMRVKVLTVKPGDTPAGFARQMAFTDYQLDRFLVLNALSPASVLKPGDRVKIIVR